MALKVRIIDGMDNATGGDLKGLTSDLIEDGGGVLSEDDDHGLVSQRAAGANMSVDVAPGVVYVPNNAYDPIDSDEPKFWEVVIDAVANKVIAANASGSTRIDLVCVKVDPTIDPGDNGESAATIERVAGTPGAGVPATPANHYKLAEVEVINGAVNIPDAKITDSREDISISKARVGLSNADNTSDATKRQKRVTAVTTSATPTPNMDTTDLYELTALAAAAAFAAPTGTPVDGQMIAYRIKDNGTARALTWNAIYRAGDMPLPTTTILGKTMYLLFMYNSADSKLDLVGYTDNF